MFGTGASSPKLADHAAERVANPPVPMPERAAAAQTAAPPVAAPQQPVAVATQPLVAAIQQPAAAPQPPAVVERAVLPGPSPIAPPVRSVDPEEIAALYRRGEVLITQGAIAAARLVFTRAAEAGDARSALALGATYDPDVLRKLGVIGVAGDPAMAREWYAKASSYGSREAAQRIELMAHGR
jgi:TPR repeat protein